MEWTKDAIKMAIHGINDAVIQLGYRRRLTIHQLRERRADPPTSPPSREQARPVSKTKDSTAYAFNSFTNS